jgi:protein pelota
LKVEVLDSKARVIKVRPESEEDLWTLRIALRRGDLLTLKTARDVRVGSGRKERIPMVLTIRVDSVEFQPFTGKLRVSGVVVEGPDEFGVKGKRHSATISPGQQVTIERPSGWDPKVVERLRSSGRGGTAIIAAIDYDEYAVAVLAPHGFTVLEDLSLSLPGKDDPAREQEIGRLTERVAKRVVEAASKYGAAVTVIVGPGPLKHEVAEKVRSMAPTLKVLVDDASMGGVAGVREALRRPRVAEALREYSILEAESIMEEFMRRMARSRDTVAYTPRDVAAAALLGAAAGGILLRQRVVVEAFGGRKTGGQRQRVAHAQVQPLRGHGVHGLRGIADADHAAAVNLIELL